MKPSVAALIAVMGVLCIGTCSTSHAREKRETVSGQIVAYSYHLPFCWNGNGYWSMVIHVQKPKKDHSEFVRVDFSLPCDESPKWLATKQAIRKFRLIRSEQSDAVLKEFLEFNCVDESHNPVPCKPAEPIRIWRFPEGTDEKLPFGRVIPSYRSEDLPLAPLV